MTEVLHLPSQDVLVVRRPEHAGEVMVPFVNEFVPSVDVDAGHLVVDDTAGLLEDEPSPSEDVGPG